MNGAKRTDSIHRPARRRVPACLLIASAGALWPGAALAEWGAGSWGEIVWNDVAASVPVLGPTGLVVLTASVIAVGSGWMKAAAQRHGDDPS